MADDLEKKVISLLTARGAKSIAVFGSYARGEAGPTSDLDLLVDFDPGLSLLSMIQIEQELSRQLGIKVDLVTEAALSPYIRQRIQPELRVIHQ